MPRSNPSRPISPRRLGASKPQPGKPPRRLPAERRRRYGVAGALFALLLAALPANAEQFKVVAAENFYGDIARQIAGSAIVVTDILSNPTQDPHEFEASPATARAFADAAVVVYNGAGYDPWAERLLSASPSASRKVIETAALAGKKPGANPHLWYDLNTASLVAARLAEVLAELDPAHKSDYRRRLAGFAQSMAPIADQITRMKTKYAGDPVTATEPIFGYMAEALGLEMRNRRFQLAVMNDTEPSARDIAAFATDLRSRNVRVLIYNSQTDNGLTRRMRAIAQKAGVSVVGVSETEPPGKDYQKWMASQLDAIDQALAH